VTSKQHILIILMLGVVFIGTGIGLRDPWPSDEPRFALIAKDMVESGEWFFPRRGGELYPDKPPLFMWSQAIVYKLTGSLRVAFLLPSLVAGLLILVLVYDAGRRLWRPRVGLLAALLLLVTPQFVLETRAGQLDAMVSCWIALGMYGFLRHLLLGPDWRWFYVGFAACGFGIITKGVGFLPILIFLPWLWARGRGAAAERPRGKNWPHALLGPLVMLAAALTWLIPMLIQVELANDPAYEAYRDNILFKQTGERYLSPSHHFKPAWYFLGNVIPSLWLPVFLLLPWALPAWRRRVARGDARYTLLLGWVALVVLFFSISPAKRGVYILPALPWISLAMAPLLSGLMQRVGVRRLALAIPSAAALGMWAGGAYLLWIKPEKYAELIQRYDVAVAAPLLSTGLAIGLSVIAWRKHPPIAYGAMMLCLWLTYGLWLAPLADTTKSGAKLMIEVEQALAPDTPLALVDWKEQTILQARRPVTNFGFLVPIEEQAAAGADWLQQHPDGRLLVQGRAMDGCFDAEESQALGTAHRREWYLVGPEARIGTCRP
jgi:4-amino-4-deoxy-L-arabinose transferase-like glycosyltransferase